MVFAVATKSSVYLYDTQQRTPFGIISNIHYTRLTDLAWSSDGQLLVVSSTDGFCSLVTFEPDELGVKYQSGSSSSKPLENVTNVPPPEASSDKPKIEVPIDRIFSVDEKFPSPVKKKKPATPIAVRRKPRSPPQSPATVPEKRHFDVLGHLESTQDIRLVVEDDDTEMDCVPIADSPPPPKAEEKPKPEQVPAEITPKTPRRVEFRTISTPKSKKKLL